MCIGPWYMGPTRTAPLSFLSVSCRCSILKSTWIDWGVTLRCHHGWKIQLRPCFLMAFEGKILGKSSEFFIKSHRAVVILLCTSMIIYDHLCTLAILIPKYHVIIMSWFLWSHSKSPWYPCLKLLGGLGGSALIRQVVGWSLCIRAIENQSSWWARFIISHKSFDVLYGLFSMTIWNCRRVSQGAKKAGPSSLNDGGNFLPVDNCLPRLGMVKIPAMKMVMTWGFSLSHWGPTNWVFREMAQLDFTPSFRLWSNGRRFLAIPCLMWCNESYEPPNLTGFLPCCPLIWYP